MGYIVVKITNRKLRKTSNDILVACLSELGYEAFEEHLQGVDAYIQEDLFDESVLQELKNRVAVLDFSYEWKVLEEKNWNKEWEENYKPVVIADKLLVRSTFHQPNPDLPYEVVINPQMSFGTGHHETTTLMLEALLEQDLHEKNILDVGCGTGILAIFAAQQGATLTAVDIEENAYQNAVENAKLNNVAERIALQKGVVQDIKEGNFDIILANINRNVLLQDIQEYADRLAIGGRLFLSGFYTQDVDLLVDALAKSNLIKVNERVLNDWVLIEAVK